MFERLTHEPRANYLTNRCIEFTRNSDDMFSLSAWRDSVGLSVQRIGSEELITRISEKEFEFDLILAKRPRTNVITYSIASRNLEFYKQPDLTDDERNGVIAPDGTVVKEQHFRPENVVNSYAVYHKFKMHDWTLYDGREENYKLGKLCHIFRPRAIDDRGDWIWCDMLILDGYLDIILDSEFLDRAKYPVVVDPVIGYNAAGASSLEANRVKTYNNMANAYLGTPVDAGITEYGFSYCRVASSGSTNARMCLWENVADPDKELSPRFAYSGDVAIDDTSEKWFAFLLGASLTGGESYGAGATFNDYFSPKVDLFYDSIAPTALEGLSPGQSCTSGSTTCIPTTLGTTGQATTVWSIYSSFTEVPESGVSSFPSSSSSSSSSVESSAPLKGKVQLATGWILGNVDVEDNQFKAELRGRTQHLSQQIVPIFSPNCRAVLGDTRCGVNLDSYRYTGTVTSISEDRRKFVDSGMPVYTEDVFKFGLLEWLGPSDSENVGYQMEVKKFTPGTREIELFSAMSFDIEVGDEFTVTYGCDKSVETCLNRFNNVENFRGEPYIPGQDKVIRTGMR